MQGGCCHSNSPFALLRDGVSAASVVIHLNRSPPFRVEVAVDGAPFKGTATAPVTIVECSDFQCPFCKRVLPTLTQLKSQYSDTVNQEDLGSGLEI